LLYPANEVNSTRGEAGMATEAITNSINIPAGKELEERWEKLRTHRRVVSRVKFQVEWEEGAERQKANAVTVDISKSGCLAVVGAGLPLRKRVRLIHSATGRTAEAHVVWRDHEAWDVGLELVKPDPSFWGVKF
jgi:PilZ domain